MLILIACLNNLGYLSKDNKLMYSFEKDMKFFKEKTLGQKVIMGRKTYESLGCNPLKQRENIIISSNFTFKIKEEKEHNNVRVLTIEEIDREIRNNPDLVYFIMGGGKIYEYFIDRVSKMYLTQVKDMSVGDKNILFPKFNSKNYKINNLYSGIELDRNSNSHILIDINEYILTKKL